MIETGDAQGRLKNRNPVAIIDIGSNSVRMVIFEGMVRTPSILFNEKVSCGLGRGIAGSRRMNDDAVESALKALERFVALARQAHVQQTYVIATAAAREAENGADFVAAAEAILGCDITILTGKEEALYSAYGIMSAFRAPDGIVGDLGGGSLELVDVKGQDTGTGVTRPLGVIRLEERAGGNVDKAMKIAVEELADRDTVEAGRSRPFYAVGGTWRNIAKLHMEERDYPLNITHAYSVEPKALSKFLKKLTTCKIDELKGIEDVSRSRRALLPYGAVVMNALIETMQPSEIIFSAYGVREGFIYSRLDEKTKALDALIEASDELAILRARSPRHARELADWTAHCFEAFGIDETVDEGRYRQAACRLADIGWRAHPDYRAAQSLAIIAYGHFVQISHEGRAFVALANYFRYQGLKQDRLAPEIEALTTERTWNRARLLGAFMRIGYLFTAAMPGVLNELRWEKGEEDEMVLVVPSNLGELLGERPSGRISQLAKVAGRPTSLRLDA